jgi:hypothetical protein
MADNDVATRAPESDAQEKPAQETEQTEQAEQSVFPGDTVAQEGPTMGVSEIAECCIDIVSLPFRTTAPQIDPLLLGRFLPAN